MKGNWLVDKRSKEQPIVVDSSGYRLVMDMVWSIKDEQEGDVLITTHVEGLPSEQTQSLSTGDFVADCGLIIIEHGQHLGETTPMFTIAERFELYHLHALYFARKSEPRGTPDHVLMKTKTYVDIIEKTTEMSCEMFVRMRNAMQSRRGRVAHPSAVVMRRCPPLVSLSDISEMVPEELVSEATTLYFKPLPNNSPVLISARIRNRNRVNNARRRT